MRDPFSEEPAEEEVEEKKSPNRTFIAILTVVGSIIILAIIVLIAFVLISRNRSAARFQEQADLINATNTAIAQQANETAAAEVKKQTEKALPPTWTPTSAAPAATSTPVPTKKPTATATTGIDSAERTATIAAFLTQVALGTTNATGTLGINQTATARATGTIRATSTALPTTDFAEDVGLPGLFGLALALVVIIVLARRLRLSTNN